MNSKRLLAVLLAVAFVIAAVPLSALAIDSRRVHGNTAGLSDIESVFDPHNSTLSYYLTSSPMWERDDVNESEYIRITTAVDKPEIASVTSCRIGDNYESTADVTSNQYTFNTRYDRPPDNAIPGTNSFVLKWLDENNNV